MQPNHTTTILNNITQQYGKPANIHNIIPLYTSGDIARYRINYRTEKHGPIVDSYHVKLNTKDLSTIIHRDKITTPRQTPKPLFST